MSGERAEQMGRIEADVRMLVGTCGEIKEQLEVMNGRQRVDHDDITTLKTRMGQWATAQALWTTGVGVVAGWFGSQR